MNRQSITSRTSGAARVGRVAAGALAALTAMTAAGTALADVDLRGQWEDEPKVSIELTDASRNEAIRKLAEEAGWSVVLAIPEGEAVTVNVEDQAPSDVLQLLLENGDYVATRKGSLVSVRPRAADKAKDGEPKAAAPPIDDDDAADENPDDDDDSPERSRDVVVTGRSVTIAVDDVVHDVVVMGGSVDVYGEARGDVTVMGGSAVVYDGAHIHGDATAVGGSLQLEEGARVDGDVGVVGGVLKNNGAELGGGVEAIGGDDDQEEASAESLFTRISRSVTNAALLFALGAVLLALAGGRMDQLRTEVAARPMRSFALGIVGSIGALLLIIALCITVIGIPIAMVAVVLGLVGVLAGTCAALTTLGGALLAHRTDNIYAHLGLGCLLYLVAGAIPWIGGLAQVGIVLAGVGSLVATRGGKVLSTSQPSGSPYR